MGQHKLKSHSYNFRGQDVVDIPDLFDHFVLHRVIDQQKRQSFPAEMLAAQVHTSNVDTTLSENGSDLSNHSGLVIVSEVDHMTSRHNLEGIAVNIHDARHLVVEDRSGDAV